MCFAFKRHNIFIQHYLMIIIILILQSVKSSLPLPTPNTKSKSEDAQKAADVAEAAFDAQNDAASQASRQVKLQLANKAKEALIAAESELAAKEIAVRELGQEKNRAESVVNESNIQLHQIQINSAIADRAARQAQNQMEALIDGLKIASINMEDARTAAEGLRKDLDKTQNKSHAAKRAYQELVDNLTEAQRELASIKEAVEKAGMAAGKAKDNATKKNNKS